MSVETKFSRPRLVTALFKKAVSYQKRQTWTNICCVSLCPLLMVLIPFILVKVAVSSTSLGPAAKDTMYCMTGDIHEGTTLSYEKQEMGVAYQLQVNVPCSYWFGENYINIGNLDPDVNVTARSYIRDSTYRPQLNNGNFEVHKNYYNTTRLSLDTRAYYESEISKISYGSVFNFYPMAPSYYYAVSDELDGLVGQKPEQALMNVETYLNVTSGDAFVSPQTQQTGILGTIPNRYYVKASDSSLEDHLILPVPIYRKINGGESELDNQIATDLIELQTLYNNRNVFHSSYEDIRIYSVHGTVYIKSIDHSKLQYSWDMSVGTMDTVLRSYDGADPPNQPGLKRLIQMTQFNNGILRNSKVSSLGNAQITQGIRAFPQRSDVAKKMDPSKEVSGNLGLFVFPLGVSFLLPFFVMVLVEEKETRILAMMKMNGVTSSTYYFSQYVTFLTLYIVSTTIFIVAGYLCNLGMFRETHMGILVLLFFVWGNVMVSMAFVFSHFFNEKRGSTIATFIIVFFSVLVYKGFTILWEPKNFNTNVFFWPPFAFYRALDQVNRGSFVPSAVRYDSFTVLAGDDPVLRAIIFMVCEVVVLLLIAAYLSAVYPSEYGVKKPWHFIFSEPFSYVFNSSSKKPNPASKQDVDIESGVSKTDKAILGDLKEVSGDDDVKAERNRVVSNSHDPNSPLVIKQLRKVFQGRFGESSGKVAVNDVSFAIEEGITFGLLGPNGAGKTTVINMLTGLYSATSGESWIGGYNVQTQTSEVYKRFGICPQFSILWDDLTIEEHLYFYARIKGITSSFEEQAVKEALESVELTALAKRLTKGLSGGERRRVCIAIALIGNPSVVFLDEPTTGLDAEVRRTIWDVINRSRQGKTIVLTTHSMEEAEVLCQRIGIMANGDLQCYAGPTRLKHLYGCGYKLSVNVDETETDKACALVESILPSGWVKAKSFNSCHTYEFQAGDSDIERVFAKMEAEKGKRGIVDWGMSETTLEEVFIKIVDLAGADNV